MRTASLLWLVVLVACGDKDTDTADVADSGDLDGDGFAVEDGDCDDADPAINPGADELCDGIDNNCDEVADNDPVDGGSFYADSDGDLFGDPGDVVVACGPPDGYVVDGTDCNDTSAGVNPGAAEICNGTDDDCDGEIDDDATDAVTFYADGDGDGYGDDKAALVACQQPTGYADVGGDCDDADASLSPGAVEQCNGIDDDCDPSTTDEGIVSIGAAAYSSISAAISAASGGDTLLICPGTYRENLVIDGKDLTLEGWGAADTTIDATSSGAAILIQAGAAVTVRGVTLVGGSADDGAGVSAAEAGDLTIEDAEITDGVAIRGGGIYGPEDALLTLSNVLIYENLASEGGGVFASQSSLVASAVYSNVADLGGGLCLDGGRHLLDKSSEIYLNEALENGGGIYARDATIDAVQVSVSQNSAAGSGGGLWLAEGQIDGGTVEDNAASYGGGIYWEGEAGGGIASVTVEDNAASEGGGGIMAIGANLEIDACTIQDNTSGTFGGGIFGESLSRTLIGSTLISGNQSLLGGGVLFYGTGAISIENSDITGNGGGFGGGGYLFEATLWLDSGSVTGNSGTYGGGGFYLDAQSALSAYTVDFGASSTDNTPEDVYVYNYGEPEVYSDYEARASFECDDTECF